jgi:hypothetical protein
MTLASLATPNSASTSAAAFMVGQSESLPIRMPTSGREDFVVLMQTKLSKEIARLARNKILTSSSKAAKI